MRVLTCPDKFRGTATALEVANAIATAAAKTGWECDIQPLADGGEGTLEAFGGANQTTTVTAADGSLTQASWYYSDSQAVIEMAQASGLSKVGGAQHNDPILASSAGTGELIALAADSGANKIIVGLGGSATTDGGLAALHAMEPLARYRKLDIEVAADVQTKFVDAAEVFSPQKGATKAQVRILRNRLERLVQQYKVNYGINVVDVPRSGAAGGLAGGLLVVGAKLCDGFQLIANLVRLREKIRRADLVITGEGCLDATSFQGKVVGGVTQLCRQEGVPARAIVGTVAEGTASIIPTTNLTQIYGAVRAQHNTVKLVEQVVQTGLAHRNWFNGDL